MFLFKINCPFLAVVFLTSGASPAYSQSNQVPQKAKELEQQAIRALTEILPGATYDLKLELKEQNLNILAEMSFAFDSKRVRMKVRHKYEHGEKKDFSDWQGPNYVILKDDVVFTRRGQHERSTIINQEASYSKIFQSKRLIWPQFVGATTVGVWMMPNKGPRGFLELNNRIATNISDEELNGIETKKVDYKMLPAGRMSVWYAPSMNGLIVKISSSLSFDTEVTVQNKEWAKGIWFPEKIITIQKLTNLEIKRETINIESLVVGKPDDKYFGLAGLEITEGHIVADSSSGKTKYYRWIKGDLVQMTSDEIELANWQPITSNADPPPIRVDKKVPEGFSTVQLLFFGSLLFVVMIAIWLFISNRTKSRKGYEN